MPFTTFPIPTNPWLSWAWASSGGGTTPRTGPARAGDWVNVLDYGADNTGVNDCATALTNAIAVNGLILFPSGTYKLLGPVTLPNVGPDTGEGYHCFGYGAFITGNFADFLFRRSHGNGNEQTKSFRGFVFQNSNAAGGIINWADATNTLVTDCRFVCDGIGVTAYDGNGPNAVTHSKFISAAGTPGGVTNSTGVAIASIGSHVRSCDFTDFDRALVLSGSNASAISNRFEVNNWGIAAGLAANAQTILSSSGTPGVSPTIINVSNTLMFTTGDGVVVDSYDGSGGYNLFGAYTVTRLNSTQLSVPQTFAADSFGGRVYIWMNKPGGSVNQGTIAGGGGLTLSSNTFEGHVVGIFAKAISGSVIQACNMLMDGHVGESFPTARAGIYLIDNNRHSVMQGNTFSGACSLGTIYYQGSGSPQSPSDLTVQSNNFEGVNGCPLANGAQVNPTTITLYETPRWLTTSATITAQPITLITAQGCSVPGGTTVIGATATTVTLSAALTGTLPDKGNLQFTSGGTAWSSGTSYSIGNLVAAVNGFMYKSVTNSNVGNNPVLDTGTNWTYTGVPANQLLGLVNLT